MGYFLFWILLCIIPAAMANSKGRSAGKMFFLSVIFSPLVGFIVAIVLERRDNVIEERLLETGQNKICPFCAEVIKIKAIACRYCGRDLEVKG